ncbi:Uncharacterised protein [Mycobacteroides abscessus subsp. massiliense]|nr:Uncharacterised protein [Mycobacteroides abscessus subsp. massiliense]
MADETTARKARDVVADEDEQGQCQHVVDIRGRRRQEFGGLTRVIGVLHGQHRNPVRHQDEDEDRHRQRQDERRDLHADGRLDLVTELNGDRFEEQLHTIGNTGRGDLGTQEQRQRNHNHPCQGGCHNGVHVECQLVRPEITVPGPVLVVTDLDGGFRLECRNHAGLCPLTLSLRLIH